MYILHILQFFEYLFVYFLFETFLKKAYKVGILFAEASPYYDG